MRLTRESGDVLLRGRAHWMRCRFEDADLSRDVVGLPALDVGIDAGEIPKGVGAEPAGLAFDSHCRLFHALPEAALLEYVLVGGASLLDGSTPKAAEFSLRPDDTELSEPVRKCARALACDDSGFLYLADSESAALWLVDVSTQKLSKRVTLPARAVDLAAVGSSIYVLLEGSAGYGVVSACSDYEPLPWPAGTPVASRLDCAGDPAAGGRVFVLCDAGTANAVIAQLGRPATKQAVPWCTDFTVGPVEPSLGTRFVCARRRGQTFRTFYFQRSFDEDAQLAAYRYDERGIALGADGRIAFWTELDVGFAVAARARYASDSVARVYGYALDSERDQSSWGQLVVEACLPSGTSLQVYAFTRDDLDFDDAFARTPPSGEQLTSIAEPESTPLLSRAQWAHRTADAQVLFRGRSSQLLAAHAAPGFLRFDAPILAPPGRYLWLVFELRGTRHKSPRLRSARVQYPGHDLLRLLPKTLWRDEAARSFLNRYLTPLSGLVSEWGDVSEHRQKLLDPCAAPASALDWLASFLGLAMDSSWPEPARRAMIREAAQLFRGRGTLWSLRRMLEILTGCEIVILECFRLRGGGVVGNPEATSSSPVLGAGLRVGGRAGEVEATSTESGMSDDDELAHRFNVTIVGVLTDSQLRSATRLVQEHKPAHTAFQLCAAERGARVGVGLHVGVAAVVGPTGGFSSTLVGEAVLGKGYIVGRPDLDPGGSSSTGAA